MPSHQASSRTELTQRSKGYKMRNAVLRQLLMNGLSIVIVVSCTASHGLAQDASPIEGSAYIAGMTPTDPPPRERKNTHAYLTIQGQGAIRMYRAMPASAGDDVCRGDGWKIKRAGHLACSISRDGNKAECDFSVELARGTLPAGNPC
jgi:hypothetical protein